MHHFHAVVWIDHREAKIFHVGLAGTDQLDLHPTFETRHIHHKANEIGSGHIHEDKGLMKDVADAVSDAGEILIIGPAQAKTELATYLREHTHIGSRIVGVEAVDHPTDGQIVAYAKKHFKIGTLRGDAPASR
ncbi:translational machinery protein [Tardiphaga sp. 20_F10_N6_6]|jgi:stalled ribosome rescue protein Dom34|uniref:translational machinery protein n=1 Tax=unclassified Tardiphaga TaxID=2631404 RepID=UPI001E5F344C|nr:translational machinery protein [Tardiphaga sp. 37S4]UFS76174.1 translational machinery protein [Tardiphaga sp. 37S4]